MQSLRQGMSETSVNTFKTTKSITFHHRSIVLNTGFVELTENVGHIACRCEVTVKIRWNLQCRRNKFKELNMQDQPAAEHVSGVETAGPSDGRTNVTGDK